MSASLTGRRSSTGGRFWQLPKSHCPPPAWQVAALQAPKDPTSPQTPCFQRPITGSQQSVVPPYCLHAERSSAKASGGRKRTSAETARSAALIMRPPVQPFEWPRFCQERFTSAGKAPSTPFFRHVYPHVRRIAYRVVGFL